MVCCVCFLFSVFVARGTVEGRCWSGCGALGVDRLGRLVCGGGSVCVCVRAQVLDASGSSSSGGAA